MVVGGPSFLPSFRLPVACPHPAPPAIVTTGYIFQENEICMYVMRKHHQYSSPIPLPYIQPAPSPSPLPLRCNQRPCVNADAALHLSPRRRLLSATYLLAKQPTPLRECPRRSLSTPYHTPLRYNPFRECRQQSVVLVRYNSTFYVHVQTTQKKETRGKVLRPHVSRVPPFPLYPSSIPLRNKPLARMQTADHSAGGINKKKKKSSQASHSYYGWPY